MATNVGYAALLDALHGRAVKLRAGTQRAVNRAHVIHAHATPHAMQPLYHRGAHTLNAFSTRLRAPLFPSPVARTTRCFHRANITIIPHAVGTARNKHANKVPVVARPSTSRHHRPNKAAQRGALTRRLRHPLAWQPRHGQRPQSH